MGVHERPVTSGPNWGGLTDIGNGLSLYVGGGVFVSTDTTLIVNHPFGTGPVFFAVASAMSVAHDVQDDLRIAKGTSANLLSYDTDSGFFKSVTSGKLTILRAASGEDALPFTLLMIGRKGAA